MLVRNIELLDNYFIDESEIIDKESLSNALGEYCVLGYFDAMSINEVIEVQADEIIKTVANNTAYKYNGKCNRKNLICLTQESDKDSEFWEYAKEFPCLFVTMLRINHEQTGVEALRKLISKKNEEKFFIAYMSCSHSEVIIIGCEKNLNGCIDKAFKIREDFPSYKTFTVLGIREGELEECKNIHNEKIFLRLNGKVKDQQEAYTFVKMLKTAIDYGKIEKTDSEYTIKLYKTLGGRDLIIEISDIFARDILPHYKMGGLLSHSNKYYQNGFFNIETELVLEHKI